MICTSYDCVGQEVEPRKEKKRKEVVVERSCIADLSQEPFVMQPCCSTSARDSDHEHRKHADLRTMTVCDKGVILWTLECQNRIVEVLLWESPTQKPSILFKWCLPYSSDSQNIARC